MYINKNDLVKVNKYKYIYDTDHSDRLIKIIDENEETIYQANYNEEDGILIVDESHNPEDWLKVDFVYSKVSKYNKEKRLIELDKDGVVFSCKYDSEGKLIKRFYQTGEYEEYIYNNCNQLIEFNSYSFEKGNNDLFLHIKTIYNEKGNPIKKTQYSSFDHEKVYCSDIYEYDESGSLLGKEVNNHRQKMVEYLYDTNKRMRAKYCSSESGMSETYYDYDFKGRCYYELDIIDGSRIYLTITNYREDGLILSKEFFEGELMITD